MQVKSGRMIKLTKHPPTSVISEMLDNMHERSMADNVFLRMVSSWLETCCEGSFSSSTLDREDNADI